MTPFSLLVKPAGGGCNLDCHYCFYKKDHAAGLMSFELAAQTFAAYAALPFAEKAVALQGGEPLLAYPSGIFELLNAYPIDKSLQTNATLVTDEIAAQLARDRWLVGASLDGPEPLNRLRGDSHAAGDLPRGLARAVHRTGVELDVPGQRREQRSQAEGGGLSGGRQRERLAERRVGAVDVRTLGVPDHQRDACAVLEFRQKLAVSHLHGARLYQIVRPSGFRLRQSRIVRPVSRRKARLKKGSEA